MNDPFRPPLHPVAWEQIKMLLDKVDQRQWPLIASWRVPNYFPPGTPIPSQYPLHFMNTLQVYASQLLKAEADQYEQFRSDERYPFWLSKLTERILQRVLNAVDAVDQTDEKASLWFQGATRPEVEQAIKTILWDLTHPYTGGIAGGHAQVEAAKTESPASDLADVPQTRERENLRDSYRAAFPDAGIMDICWAAKQHYRDWTRWLKGEHKNGSKPDRAFRYVLVSGKDAKQLRKEIRPKNWK